jgi:Uma2 family endonuclease
MLRNYTSLYNMDSSDRWDGDVMATEAVEIGITEADLLRLSAQDKLVEVVNGELVVMTPVGFLHHWIGGRLHRILDRFVEENKLGHILMDGLIYVLERSSHGKVLRSRVPDISFIRAGRIPRDFDLSKPFPGAPDLAIEVISSDETAESILEKVHDYLKFGSEQVWLLYPDQKEVYQYIKGEDIVHIYRVGDAFEAPALFPGLKIVIAELFTLPNFD